MAKICRFYGVTPEQIRAMQPEDMFILKQSIPIFEAEESLRLIQAATFPKMKNKDREMIYRGLQKIVNPSLFKARPMSAEEVQAKLAKRGRS